MTIRMRLTLWYSVVVFISLLAMGLFSYHEFVVEPRDQAREKGAVESESESDTALEAFGIVFTCGVPAAILAFGGGWWFMRKAMAEVTALTRAAEQLNERNLGEQLRRSGNGDELDRLTEVFNEMTARLNSSFQRIREFTLHASHELKTPLTILHSELETQLVSSSLSAGQREAVLSQRNEIPRLTRIVDGLSLLTKADAGQVPLKVEELHFDELVREACADAQILAKPANVKVHLLACESAFMRGDRHRLRQLLLNLTDNAIKYNQPGGSVDVEMRCVGGSLAVLTITNTGKGIPTDKLPRVFDRFFRGDPSHNNEVDGCGLGLSIARWIALAHDGSIKINSVPSEFTKVTVTFPVKASVAESLAVPA
jgi:signal transduction histidine kinase